ncbi:SsrA-binding protein SmpB [Bacteroidetes bacterium endosymbiont of Geopemphigus sp.]|uniref:SsrA-binding protein SmpB n=1 Tax=Bacteroidetes bacterium endosymbiont of Geopemphigus sp. TaxID=2047937 RepID=UPI001F4D6F4B|nr:SsrA-binding protein SmpB [Bacteroidetes bacterium endosymbiont of Geopemphigus sp.]
MKKTSINIQNRKAHFEYELLDEYTAGLALLGTEIKSIRGSKASIAESFCQIKDGELYVINMYIAEYQFGTHANHNSRRERKLLLKNSELRKLKRKLKESALTVIPKRLFINEKGLAKLQIFLAKGKKIYDKRDVIRKREMKIQSASALKYR